MFLGTIFNKNYEEFEAAQTIKNERNNKSEGNISHYIHDNIIDHKSDISYNKKLDNPLNITNFNISINSPNNNDK